MWFLNFYHSFWTAYQKKKRVFKVINDFFLELKNWWTTRTAEDMNDNEFERLESKHTRVRHDKDLQERIRVH